MAVLSFFVYGCQFEPVILCLIYCYQMCIRDSPNTVKRAMAVLSRLDVDMVNLHAAGTSEMMRAALEGLTRPDGTRPLLIAVTQLTSTDEMCIRDRS